MRRIKLRKRSPVRWFLESLQKPKAFNYCHEYQLQTNEFQLMAQFFPQQIFFYLLVCRTFRNVGTITIKIFIIIKHVWGRQWLSGKVSASQLEGRPIDSWIPKSAVSLRRLPLKPCNRKCRCRMWGLGVTVAYASEFHTIPHKCSFVMRDAKLQDGLMCGSF